MNWLDIIIAIVLVVSMIMGFANGLIKSLMTLAGLVVGIFLAGRFYENLAGAMGFISNENAAKIVAFIIIFAVVMIIAAIASMLLTKLVSAILLGWINRLGGAAFGLILGAIFIAAILAIWAKYAGNSLIEGSALASFLLDTFPFILGLLPSEFDSVRNFFQQ